MPLKLASEVRLLPTADGGRTTALGSGWRGIVWFGERWTEQDKDLWPEIHGPFPLGEELAYGCELRLDPSTETLAPGASARAELTLLFLDDPRPAIHAGAEFELREGKRKIGSGRTLA